MDTQKPGPHTAGSSIDHEKLRVTKQEVTKLFTQLREVCQKSNNWNEVQPTINKLDGMVTNFFQSLST